MPTLHCAIGFDASFVQFGARDLTRDEDAWQARLELLRALGVRTIVIQFTGDEHGGYDGREPGHAPVRALLRAAALEDMQVYLGLYADPRWPEQFELTGLPAPLADARGRAELSALSKLGAFSGFYIPHEIDEQTWANEPRASRLADFLARTAATLRAIAPGKPIAIAPFYAESVPPSEYAAFWRQILADHPVDILMLQDGAGARATADTTNVQMLQALRDVLDPLHVELWSVVEVFQQRSGPPVSDGEFSAVAAEYERVRASMIAQRPWVRRMIAFSVLDYMDPEHGGDQRRLYESYVTGCGQ